MYEELKKETDYEELRKKQFDINQKNQNILNNPINFKKNTTSKLITRANSNIFPKNIKDNKGVQTNNYTNYNLFALGYLNDPFNKKEEHPIQKTFTEFYKNQQIKEHSNIIYRNEKELMDNTTSFFNKTYNEKNQINDFNLPNLLEIKKKKLIKRNIKSKKGSEYPPTGGGNNEFIKRSRSNLIDKKHKKIFNNPINRYLSSRIYPNLKKKKQNAKNKFPNDKNNINANRCVSPSTTNNSYLHSNNNSSNINFKMSFTSNMFPKKSKNVINEINGDNIKNIKGNNISKNILEKDIKMTAIEYQLNKLLARKEKEKEKTKNKYNKIEKDNEAINIEEIYSKYLNEKAQKLSLVEMEKEKDDTIHSNKKYENTSQKIDYLITKNNYINNFINANKNKNNKINSGINEDLSYNLWLSKNIDYKKNRNKIFSNPIIRYAFFDKMINNITRKVSIVNKSSEKELELNISGNLNEKNDKNDIFDKKCQKNKICKDFKTYGYELMPEKILSNKKEINKEVNINSNKLEKENKKEKENEQQMKKPNSTYFMNGKNKSTLHKNKYDKKNNIEESKSITKENVRNILNGDKKNKNKAYCLIDNNLSNILNRNDNKLKFSFTYTNESTGQNYDYLDFLGDSSRRNKLNWNLISESDKEQGRILWKKLTANSPSISNKKSSNSNTIEKKQINTKEISNILKYPKIKEEIINNIIKNKSCKEIKKKENRKDDSKRQKLHCKRRNSSMIFQNIKNLKLSGRLKDISISEDEDEEEEESEDNEVNQDIVNKDKDKGKFKDKDKGKGDNNEKNKSKEIYTNNNGNNNHKVNNFEKSPKIKVRNQKRYETHSLDKKNFTKFEKEKGFEKIEPFIEKEEEELDFVEKNKDKDKETINEFEEEKIIKEVTEEKESKTFFQDENNLSKNRKKNINKSISRYNKSNAKKENKKNKFINLSKNNGDKDKVNINNNDKKEINLNINLYSALFHKQKNHRNKIKNQDLIGLSEYFHSSSSSKSSKSIKKGRYKVKVNQIIKGKNKSYSNKNKLEIKTQLYKGKDDKNKSKISNNKNQSLIIEENHILDDLIPDEFKDENENELIAFSPNYSKKDILCLSEDNRKSKRWEKYRKHILEPSSYPISSSHVIKNINQLELFDNFVKNYKSKHYKDEDEKMNKYYDEIYNKYGKGNEKTNPKNLVDIKIFGLEFKISLKSQRNYYKNFMKNVRFQNIKRRDEININKRLSFLLDKYNLQKLKEKNNKILNQRKSKINNIGIKKYFGQNTDYNGKTEKKQVGADEKDVNQTKIEKKEEDKVDPKKEMKRKKNELLLKLKHDVKYKIHMGEVKVSEMDNFNKFKKMINEIPLEGNNIELYISQLEQRFHSYEKELKLKEEKRDEESRINSFIDSMNYDFHIKNQIKHIQEKNFCNAIDFKQKNIINMLSPVQANNKKRFSKYQDYKK